MVNPISVQWFISLVLKVGPWTSSIKKLHTNAELGLQPQFSTQGFRGWIQESVLHSPRSDSDVSSNLRSAVDINCSYSVAFVILLSPGVLD